MEGEEGRIHRTLYLSWISVAFLLSTLMLWAVIPKQFQTICRGATGQWMTNSGSFLADSSWKRSLLGTHTFFYLASGKRRGTLLDDLRGLERLMNDCDCNKEPPWDELVAWLGERSIHSSNTSWCFPLCQHCPGPWAYFQPTKIPSNPPHHGAQTPQWLNDAGDLGCSFISVGLSAMSEDVVPHVLWWAPLDEPRRIDGEKMLTLVWTLMK